MLIEVSVICSCLPLKQLKLSLPDTVVIIFAVRVGRTGYKRFCVELLSTLTSKTWQSIKLHPTSEIKAGFYCSGYTSLARLTECL